MIYAVLVLGGIGLTMGLFLAFASKKFEVEIDPNVEKIMDILPGANCGACGYPGCVGLAEAIYKGDNGWRTRDYRYLGTIGLFDGIFLNLKKGENTLLMAVSESFGGWLITGKFDNDTGINILN